MTNEELSLHRKQSVVWSHKIRNERSHKHSEHRVLCRLIESYDLAVSAFDLRECFPGRWTAASNAVRSLEASIRGMWFDLEGDEFQVKP